MSKANSTEPICSSWKWTVFDDRGIEIDHGLCDHKDEAEREGGKLIGLGQRNSYDVEFIKNTESNGSSVASDGSKESE